MKYNKYIVNLHPIFSENATILAQRLNIEIVNEYDPKENDLIIIFGVHEKALEILSHQLTNNFKYGLVIIASEQMNSKAYENKYYIELLRRNVVFPFSFSVAKDLKEKYEIESHSIYFFDFYHIEDTIPFEERPIDFFFAGMETEYRKEQLELLKKANPDAVFEIDFNYSYQVPIDMMKKLKDVKYVINIPYYKESSLETHRINRAISAGCKCISLRPSRKYEETGYQDYVNFVDSFENIKTIKPLKDWNDLMEKIGKSVISHNVEKILSI